MEIVDEPEADDIYHIMMNRPVMMTLRRRTNANRPSQTQGLGINPPAGMNVAELEGQTERAILDIEDDRKFGQRNRVKFVVGAIGFRNMEEEVWKEEYAWLSIWKVNRGYVAKRMPVPLCSSAMRNNR